MSAIERLSSLVLPGNGWLWLVLVLVEGTALAAAVHALLNKKQPSTAFGWIGVSLLFPPLGPLLYYMFGINRVRMAAQRLDRQSRYGLDAHRPGAHAQVRDYRGRISDGQLMLAAAGDRLSPWPLVFGNTLRPLRNGEQAYPPMLEAIERAQSFVYLSTYIFESNTVGQRFIDALGRAIERGVDVRVLLDGIGAYYHRPSPQWALRSRGVNVARFLPPRLLPPSLQLNLRNHRKILVTDGTVAFTGGMNIGDRHLPSRGGIKDMHFRLTGPIVRQIEAVFLSDWAFVTGEQVPISSPRQNVGPGGVACRCLAGAPIRDVERLAIMLVTAAAAARSRILIMTPYFLPSDRLVGVLQAAALRGIEVVIVLPARNNLPYVGWAAHHGLAELLKRGVKVFYQPPPFAHTKLFVVDDEYALVGSPNIDPRSLRLNFELAVEVYDRASAAQFAEHIRAAAAESTACSLADLEARSFLTRLRDSFFWLFSPYM